jgi:cytochrome P450
MELVRERLEPLLLARKRLRCCGRDVADRILKDSEAFTLRRDDGSVTGFQWWMPAILHTLANNMLSMDEPDHRRLRDIVDRYARKLPLSVICELLGLPPLRRIAVVCCPELERVRPLIVRGSTAPPAQVHQ